MEIIKDYYYLKELEKNFEIPLEDVQYFVTKGSIELHVNIKPTKLIMGVKGYNCPMVGSAVVEYRGLISLEGKSGLEILENNSTGIFEFRLHQKDNIRIIDTKYPLSLPMPNPVILSWSPFDESYEHDREVDLRVFWGIFFPNETPPIFKKFNDIFESADDLTRDQIENILLYLGKIPKPTIPTVQSIFQDNEQLKRVHLIHLVIERLLDTNEAIRSDKMWALLRKDINKNNRDYDIDNVIDKITPETMQWVDKSDDKRELSFRGFKNAVSKIKKTRKLLMSSSFN